MPPEQCGVKGHNIENTGKYLTASPVLYVQKILKHYVLVEDKLDDIGARMETKSRKPLHRLVVYTAVSKFSDHAIKILKVRSYKIKAAHSCLSSVKQAAGIAGGLKNR
jgi:hypothetical protein